MRQTIIEPFKIKSVEPIALTRATSGRPIWTMPAGTCSGCARTG